MDYSGLVDNGLFNRIALVLWMLPNPSPLAQGRPLVYRATSS